MAINLDGGKVSVTSPTGGIAETITENKTYIQDYNTTLTYGKLTKENTSSSTTYTVTYDSDGGSTQSAGTATYSNSESSATTEVTLPTPTKTGYTFKGWSGSNDLSSGIINYTTSNPYNAAARDHVLGNEFSVT